jgi:AP-3 complex subunit beta
MIRTDDIRQVKQVKLEIMLKIINHDNHQAILREFVVGIGLHIYCNPHH